MRSAACSIAENYVKIQIYGVKNMSLSVKQQENIEILKKEAALIFSEDYSGHDYLHTSRVLSNAVALHTDEGGDLYIIELAAILHDFDDVKISPETSSGMKNAERMLRIIGEDENTVKIVKNIIESVAFSKHCDAQSIEAKIVQDADRLDAIGAIGIARCFAYAGNRKNPIYYDSDFIKDKESGCDSAVAHFFQKLLRIEERMQTQTGRLLARKRSEFLENFLMELYSELNENTDMIFSDSI